MINEEKGYLLPTIAQKIKKIPVIVINEEKGYLLPTIARKIKKNTSDSCSSTETMRL